MRWRVMPVGIITSARASSSSSSLYNAGNRHSWCSTERITSGRPENSASLIRSRSLYKEELLEFKPCFGAVAGYVDGKIFVSYGNFGLALKLPPGPRSELLERQGGTPLRYFPKGHVKKEYVVIPPRILDHGPTFRGLVRRSVEYVCPSGRLANS